MKKVLTLLLCLGLVLPIAAKEHFVVDGIHYYTNYYAVYDYGDGSTVSVGNSESCWEEFTIDIVDCIPWMCGPTESYVGDIVIPEKVSYEGKEYTVVRIGVAAFANCSNLKSVKMPATIERVDEGAFYGCSALEHIEFSDKVRGIGEMTLYGCAALEKLDLSGVKDFVNLNLYSSYSPNLKEVILPPDAVVYRIYGAGKDCAFSINNPLPPRPQVFQVDGFGEGSVLYVPESGEGYFDTMWGRAFGRRVEYKDFSAVEDVKVSSPAHTVAGNTVTAPAGERVEVYDLNGRLLDVVAPGKSKALVAGVYVLRCTSVSEKIVIQ